MRIALICTFLFQFACHLLARENFGDNGVVVMKQEQFEERKHSFEDIFSIVLDSVRGRKTGRGENFIGECMVCAKCITWIKDWLEDGLSYDDVATKLETRCSFFHIETYDVCHGAITLFKGVVLDVLHRTSLDSYEICDIFTKLNCSGHEVPSMEWTIDIPTKVMERPITKDPAPMVKALKVLHLTDIHVDFKYRPSSKVDCNQPLCCRGGVPSIFGKRAGYWGSVGKCDLPRWTVEDLFQRLSQEKFDYIIWTGDLLSHNIWNQTKKEQFEALNFLVDLFVKYFPGTAVYPALGNHEGVPTNNFPQHSISTKESADWLYQALSSTWSKWTSTDVQPTVTRGGFYTALVAPKFRLVSLNMNFCNNYNWWLMLDSKDPESELEWLVSVLQSAEENGEKVQIIGHIPPGIPDCLKAWSWNYYRVVNRYKDTIAAQFFGHIHYDSFQLFYNVESANPNLVYPHPVSVAYMAPSLTTFQYLNPGYRVYDVEGFQDNSTWSVLDHHTYIMDVAKTAKSKEPVWVHEYSAKEAYKMESLTAEEWDKTVTKMREDKAMFDEYRRFYYKSNPTGWCLGHCRRNMLCSLVSGRSYDDTFCNKLYNNDNSSRENGLEPFRYSDYVLWHHENKLC